MQRTIRMSSLIFRPGHNTLARLSLVVIAAGAGGTVGGLLLCARTPYARNMQAPIEQPLQFDHRHHTRDEGIDCRYCHNSVEKAPFAGIPPTQLCLNCHSQIWNKSPLLEPIRKSFIEDKPMVWNRVQGPGVCLLQPLHSCEQRRGLRDLPRPGGSNGGGRKDVHADHELVPRLPSQSREESAPCRGGHKHDLAARGRSCGNGDVLAEKNDVHTRTSCTTCHR